MPFAPGVLLMGDLFSSNGISDSLLDDLNFSTFLLTLVSFVISEVNSEVNFLLVPDGVG